MHIKRYIIISLLVYFFGLYLFFTTEFVSYEQLDGYSEKSLLEIDDRERDYLETRGKEMFGGNYYQGRQSSWRESQLRDSNSSVSQVVLIVIDALRYDYLQRIQFFKSTKQKHPQTTIIKKALVGNPTMTTQRIQSMMTGSQIFTSTNILDMFLSSKIKTDNIVDQLFRNNKTIKVFGDDTWMKIFNISAQSAYVCDSTFNIRDYDSCDELIYQNLHKFVRQDASKRVSAKKYDNREKDMDNRNQQEEQQLQSDKTQQYDNLLIAHFLSLDHIGHSTSSITSPHMQQKMQRISLYLQYLISSSAQQTMFIIIGDHGMREDGNHGGNSLSQTQSLFFAHYKTSNKKQNFSQRVSNFQSTHINQVDLTPTLALLLNVPNPINSIGYPILEILPLKYQLQLNKISYNILVGYQNIIDHYHKKLLAEYQLEQQCINKINSVKYSLLSHRRSSFIQSIQIKQYIKTQIQQSKCLSARLSMVQPNNIFVVVSLIIISVGLLLVVGSSFIGQISGEENNSFPIRELFSNNNRGIGLLVIQQLGWICSLFVIYYSWYLMRNSSTYMVIVMVVYAILMPSISMNYYKKMVFISLLFILVQFQPSKINQYQQNYFQFKIIENLISILSSLLPITQSSQSSPPVKEIKAFLHVIAIAMWTIYHLKKYLNLMKRMRKSKKMQSLYQQQHINTSNTYYCLILILLLMNFILIILQWQINNFSNNKSKITTSNYIDENSIKLYLRYALSLLLAVKLCLQCKQYSTTYDSINLSHFNMTLIIGFGQVLGYENFLSLLVYLQLICLVLGLNTNANTNGQKRSTNSESQNNKRQFNAHNNSQQQLHQQSTHNQGTRIILVSLLSQFMWWMLGNRYQYSSIDIKKSYLFSDEFILPLNTISMLLWFNGPYIISVVLVHCALSKEIQKLDRNQQALQQYTVMNNNLSHNQQHDYSPSQQSSLHISQQQSFTITSLTYQNLFSYRIFHTINLTKLLFVPLSGLFSSALNLYFNNMKILFTVVYVPLMVLGIVKVVVLTIVIVILLLIKK